MRFPEKAREMIETAVREGSLSFDWVHTRLSGETFPAEVLFSRIETDGDAWLQANVRDITERKRAERELRESRQLSSRSWRTSRS